MVSEKMHTLGTKKSTIRTIFEYGRKRAAEVGEENVYDFSIGNPAAFIDSKFPESFEPGHGKNLVQGQFAIFPFPVVCLEAIAQVS